MPKTIIVACKTAAEARAERLALALDYTTITVGKTADVEVNPPGVDWDKVKFIVIATEDDVEGPFPAGPG